MAYMLSQYLPEETEENLEKLQDTQSPCRDSNPERLKRNQDSRMFDDPFTSTMGAPLFLHFEDLG